jgi:hypothetical protein
MSICRAHQVQRAAFRAFAQRRHAAAMHVCFMQLRGNQRLRDRLRRGRRQRAFCAWAFVAGVLRWRALRTEMRVWGAWRRAVMQRRGRLQRADAHRRATLRSRAWSAWHAEHVQARRSRMLFFLASHAFVQFYMHTSMYVAPPNVR